MSPGTVRRNYVSYWILPLISALLWLTTLLTLLFYWIFHDNREVYPSMEGQATIAFISDVGAYTLKPLFITGCILTTVFLNASFLADRLLRHRGRLVPNQTVGEKVLAGLTIFFAFVGMAGLILLSVFDTYRHSRMHLGFLLFFMGGYILAAVFVCWEYQRLGARNRGHRVLRLGFWVKLGFIVLETGLCAIFVAMIFTNGNWNIGAVIEWLIAFIFSLFILSFAIDLYPAIYTKQGAQFPKTGINRRQTDFDAEAASRPQPRNDGDDAGEGISGTGDQLPMVSAGPPLSIPGMRDSHISQLTLTSINDLGATTIGTETGEEGDGAERRDGAGAGTGGVNGNGGGNKAGGLPLSSNF